MSDKIRNGCETDRFFSPCNIILKEIRLSPLAEKDIYSCNHT